MEPKNVIRKEGESPEAKQVADRLFELTGHKNWFNPLSFPIAQTVFRTHLTNCKNPRLLDIGCGNGEFARLFLSEYPTGRVTCVDASSGKIDSARNRLTEFLDRVDFLVESLEGLSQHKDIEQFDGIFAANVLHFISDEDLESCLHTLQTFLKKTGIFVSIQQVSLPKHLKPY